MATMNFLRLLARSADGAYVVDQDQRIVRVEIGG